MADSRPGSGLQTLFAIFLGLMLTAFVGIGVYTFYPGPYEDYSRRIERVDRDQEAIRAAKPESELTAEDRARIQELTDETNRLRDELRVAGADWGRRTSIILIILATLVMAVSLVRAGQLPVLPNGFLIGGVLSMVYGVGWIVFSDTSPKRFIVMSVALVVTLALGYLRFVRGRATPAKAGAATPTEGLDSLDERIGAIERRLDEAAAALGTRG